MNKAATGSAPARVTSCGPALTTRGGSHSSTLEFWSVRNPCLGAQIQTVSIFAEGATALFQKDGEYFPTENRQTAWDVREFLVIVWVGGVTGSHEE